MSTNAPVTRKDIDDVLQVLDVMMARIDERFSGSEASLTTVQRQTQHVLNQLDARRN